MIKRRQILTHPEAEVHVKRSPQQTQVSPGWTLSYDGIDEECPFNLPHVHSPKKNQIKQLETAKPCQGIEKTAYEKSRHKTWETVETGFYKDEGKKYTWHNYRIVNTKDFYRQTDSPTTIIHPI